MRAFVSLLLCSSSERDRLSCVDVEDRESTGGSVFAHIQVIWKCKMSAETLGRQGRGGDVDP